MASRYPTEGERGRPSRGRLRSNRGGRPWPPSAAKRGDDLVDEPESQHHESKEFPYQRAHLPKSGPGSYVNSASVRGRNPKYHDYQSGSVQSRHRRPTHGHHMKHTQHSDVVTGTKKNMKFSSQSYNPNPKKFAKEKDRSWMHAFRSLSNDEIKVLCSSGISVGEIACKLHKDIKLFQMTLVSNHIQRNIGSIVFILSKLTALLDGHCESEHQKYALQILGEAFSDRCPDFHFQLKLYVKSLSTRQQVGCYSMPRHSQSSVAGFNAIQQVLQLFQNLLQHVPALSWSCLPVDELAQTISQSPELSQHRSEMQAIMCLHDQMKQFAMSTPQSVESAVKWDNSEYRDVQILPTREEVCTPAPPAKLRANIVKGCYSDWMDYYDVQFRLLREDFIAPLRAGICGYIDGVHRRKLHDIKVYENVIIIEPNCSENGTLYLIQFDVSKFQRCNWEHSKKLLFGSLLGLSCDGFDTLMFATVANRDPVNLQEGKIEVKFQNNSNILPHCKCTVFTMVESVAYYEGCCHVLQSLQTAEAETMPFTSYLVSNQCDEVLSPQYLRDGSSVYDLGDLNGKDAILFHKSPPRSSSDVLDFTQWPSVDGLQLDQSQYTAVQMALTQEVAVIQGPPGTGKTYIGMKIVQTLIRNRAIWDPHKHSPILIICFTNHALDQFLEGIIDLFDVSPKVVRVGGRCKNEAVSKFTIQNLRRSVHVPAAIWKLKDELKDEKDKCFTRIQRKLHEYYNCIQRLLGLNELIDCASDEHIYEIEMNAETEEELRLSLKLWLGLVGQRTVTVPVRKHTGQSVLPKKSNESILQQNQMQLSYENLVAHTGNRSLEDNITDSPEESSTALHTIGNMESLNETADLDEADEAVDDDMRSVEEELIEIQGEASVEESARMLDGETFETKYFEFPFAPMNPECPELNVESEDSAAIAPDVHVSSAENETLEYDHDENTFQTYSHPTRKEYYDHRDANLIFHRNSRLPPMTWTEVNAVESVHQMKLDDRWRLYNYWHSVHVQRLLLEVEAEFEEYDSICEKIKQAKQQADRFTLETADIVAMTTTGASKYQHILHLVKPKIVIVEEAAEVLEAHIVSALNAGTQHLILIGDHKQLRPKPNTYVLGKDFKLDVSLFERLVTNKFPHVTLHTQHRMRPEIAQLVCPHIYQTLINHDSVLHYDKVRGVSSNLFFIQHTFQEKENENLSSHSNPHEADFLVALCKYLLQQGYKPSQITILVTYTGQLLSIRKLMPKEKFNGVRVSTVDNFQGEENDLILLSLVRSNPEGKVGFLREQNRVCVAVSRAKVGFYCIGNFKMLREHSIIWDTIMSDMEKKGDVAEGLHLCCSNHPATVFEAKFAKDFDTYSPAGGCQKNCIFRLPCGHVCTLKCHITDSSHTEYKCKKNCTKKCPEGHPCPKRCFAPCGLCNTKVVKNMQFCAHSQEMECFQHPNTVQCTSQCDNECPEGHACPDKCHEPNACERCEVKVQKLLPLCGHLQLVPCHMNPKDYNCKAKCEKMCSSGHQCSKACSQECGACEIKVKKVIPQCNHEMLLPCFQKPELKLCTNPCKKILYCGHLCSLQCGQYCNPRACIVVISKELSCGHTRQVACNQSSVFVKCEEPCTQLLSCGHPCRNKCCQPCTEQCNIIVNKKWPCGHKVKRKCFQTQKPDLYPCMKKIEEVLPCGHRYSKACGEKRVEKCSVLIHRKYDCGHINEVPCSSTKPCQALCKVQLSCGHLCRGKCSQCTASRVHSGCQYTVQLKRFCGHSNSVPCLGMQDTHPKKMLCQSSCPHKKCSHDCSTKCEPCKEPCVWECSHHHCSKACSEVCDRPPCNERCPKRMKCGHQCFGVCGEPCLKVCPNCYKPLKKLLKVGKFDPALKYIQLPCDHIFPINFMDEHVERMMQDNRVGPLSCPDCKLPMLLSYRYGNNAKQCMKEVHAVADIVKQQQESLVYRETDLRTIIEKHVIKAALHSLISRSSHVRMHSRSGYYYDHATFPPCPELTQPLLEMAEQLDEGVSLSLEEQYVASCFVNVVKLLAESATNGLDCKITEVGSSLKTQVLQSAREILNLKSRKCKLSPQFLIDIQSELYRLYLLVQYCMLQKHKTLHALPEQESPTLALLTAMQRNRSRRLTRLQFLDYSKQQASEYETLFHKKMPFSFDTIIAEEQLPPLLKGEWLKCPTGHFYCSPVVLKAMKREQKCPYCM